MASTLKAERNAVRIRLNDLNTGNAILQADLVDAAIQDVFGMMVNDGLSVSSWSGAYVNLSDGINEYLGGTAEFSRIQAIRISDTFTGFGNMLSRVDPVTIKDLQGTITVGTPTMFSLVPNGGVTSLLVYPTPGPDDEDLSLDVLFDPGVENLALDTDQLALSRTGLSALRELSAAKIAKKLGPKMLEKLDLLPDAWQDMKANGERMLYSEKLRVARQLRTINVQQWIA